MLMRSHDPRSPHVARGEDSDADAPDDSENPPSGHQGAQDAPPQDAPPQDDRTPAEDDEVARLLGTVEAARADQA